MILSNIKNRLLVVTVPCLLLSLVRPVLAQWGTNVDDFNTDQSNVETKVEGTVYGDQDGGDILGGEREISTTCTSMCANGVSAGVFYGELSHNQGTRAMGYSVITWDGNDGSSTLNPVGLNHVNLTSDNSTMIHVIGVRADHSGSSLILTVYTDATHWSVATKMNLPELEEPVDYQFVFATDFTTPENADGPANFADVGAITLQLDGSNVEDLDMSFDLIAAGGPTALSLTSFNAAPASGNILLSWETGSETSLQGFNLHRSETADGAYTQINTSVIPAENQGQPIGTSYSWLDDDVVRGETYYYKLEGLEDGGLTTFFGPVSARAVHIVYLPLLVRE